MSEFLLRCAGEVAGAGIHMTDRDYELMREERDNALADLAAEREKVKGLEGERDKLALVRSAAVVLLKLWSDFTSQEMYGEHLRMLDTADTQDFADWDAAHGSLRRYIDAYDTAMERK